MSDIAGLGTIIRLIATNTFPNSLLISEFADDADPVDLPELTIADAGMGLNGDIITWSQANPLPATMAIITGTDDDRNLQILFEANRAGKGKVSARDTILMAISYPDGGVTTLRGGACISFMPSRSITSEGRFKSNVYKFMFENRTMVIGG